jgi:hypothetical protein
MKKVPADGASLVSQSLAASVPASRICSLAAYASGICGENSRDSLSLRDVRSDVTYYCIVLILKLRGACGRHLHEIKLIVIAMLQTGKFFCLLNANQYLLKTR